MKYIKSLFVLLAFVSLNAFAAMSPGEIGKLIDSGNLSAAETALIDVLKERDVAKVHYMLAQVYQQQRRSLDAKNELAKADAMDPTHSYTTNEKYQAQAAKILAVAAPVAAAAAQVAGHPVAKPAKPDDGVSFGFIMLAITGSIIVIGLVIYGGGVYLKRKEEQEAKDALDEKISGLQSRVSTLVQTTENALLSEKTASNPVTGKIDAFSTVKRKVLNLYERVKNDSIETEAAYCTLLDECRSLELLLDTVMTKSYTVSAQADNVQVKTTPKPQRQATVQRNPQGKATWNHQIDERPPAPPAQRPERETIIVNNGSSVGDVLATSILIDSMNHSHDREREEARREQEREDDRRAREQQREDDRREREREEARREQEREEESRRSSSWSSSSSDSGSSSSWGSSDSGSSDSWSSSSSDSGSSSSWD